MKFIDSRRDPWRTLGGEDGPPVSITPAPHLLLELTQWHACRAHWPDGMPVGVLLSNDTDIEDLVDDLPRIALVALQFPKWVDGRAYSQARLLRARYRYAGEVRATGAVLVDMLPLLARTGFDAADLRSDQSIDAAERALSHFRAHYQGDARQHLPLFALPPGSAEALAHAADEEFLNLGASI